MFENRTQKLAMFAQEVAQLDAPDIPFFDHGIEDCEIELPQGCRFESPCAHGTTLRAAGSRRSIVRRLPSRSRSCRALSQPNTATLVTFRKPDLKIKVAGRRRLRQ